MGTAIGCFVTRALRIASSLAWRTSKSSIAAAGFPIYIKTKQHNDLIVSHIINYNNVIIINIIIS